MIDPTLAPLWDRLAAVTAFSFVSKPGPASRTRWAGEAQGEVAVSEAGGTLLFTETGRFVPAGDSDRTITIHNQYGWTPAGAVLRVAHHRFAEPVFLVELVPAGGERFESRAPHRCGEDRYALALRLTAEAILADWQIRGPVKDELLAYRYTA